MTSKKNKEIVSRKCIVTGQIIPIEKLIRFVLLEDGTIALEKDKKIYGRGSYCLKNEETINELFKRKLLNRSFKRNIPIDTYNELRKDVNEYVKKQK